MDLIRSWLTQVICAALIAAAADGLMPKGPVKKVGTLICAMVLLCVVLRPVVNWSVSVPDTALGEIWEESQVWQEQLEQDSGTMLKTLIERQTGAYISDKAASLGVACQVEVACAQQDGIWVPQTVYITGKLNAEQQRTLTAAIQSELGIPPECQVCTGGE